VLCGAIIRVIRGVIIHVLCGAIFHVHEMIAKLVRSILFQKNKGIKICLKQINNINKDLIVNHNTKYNERLMTPDMKSHEEKKEFKEIFL